MNIQVNSVNAAPRQTHMSIGQQLDPHAFRASNLLKALGHEGRLMTLTHLANGEKSVAKLQELLSAPQALVSSHLARLRHEGLVRFRKEGKACYYSIKDEKARQILGLLDQLYN